MTETVNVFYPLLLALAVSLTKFVFDIRRIYRELVEDDG